VYFVTRKLSVSLYVFVHFIQCPCTPWPGLTAIRCVCLIKKSIHRNIRSQVTLKVINVHADMADM
jgi:hypothetical protein